MPGATMGPIVEIPGMEGLPEVLAKARKRVNNVASNPKLGIGLLKATAPKGSRNDLPEPKPQIQKYTLTLPLPRPHPCRNGNQPR